MNTPTQPINVTTLAMDIAGGDSARAQIAHRTLTALIRIVEDTEASAHAVIRAATTLLRYIQPAPIAPRARRAPALPAPVAEPAPPSLQSVVRAVETSRPDDAPPTRTPRARSATGTRYPSPKANFKKRGKR